MSQISLRTKIYKTQLDSTKIKLVASISDDIFLAISNQNELLIGKVIEFYEWNGKTTVNPFIPLATQMDVDYIKIFSFQENIVDMKWSSLKKHLCLCDENGNAFIFESKEILKNIVQISEETNESQTQNSMSISESHDERKRRRIDKSKSWNIKLSPIHIVNNVLSKEPGRSRITMLDCLKDPADHLVAVSRDYSKDIYFWKIHENNYIQVKNLNNENFIFDILFIPSKIENANSFLYYYSPLDLFKSSSTMNTQSDKPLFCVIADGTVEVWDASNLSNQLASYRPSSSISWLYGLNYFYKNGVAQIGTVGEDRSVIVYDTNKFCAQSTWKQCMKYAPGNIFFSPIHKNICYIFGRDSQELKASDYISTKVVKRNTSMFSSTRWRDTDFFVSSKSSDKEKNDEVLIGCNESGEVYLIYNPDGMYGGK